MKNSEIQFLLDVALRASKESKAIRTKVGGVVTDSKGNIVAYGYNGSIRGSEEELEYKVYLRDKVDWKSGVRDKVKYPFSDPYPYHEEYYRLVTNENVTIHAEQNLIAHAARRGISIDGGIVALTLSPCTKCTSLLIQCGIREIIFIDKYRLFQETEDLYGKHVKLTQWSGNV